jgi:hypothetical protein
MAPVLRPNMAPAFSPNISSYSAYDWTLAVPLVRSNGPSGATGWRKCWTNPPSLMEACCEAAILKGKGGGKGGRDLCITSRSDAELEQCFNKHSAGAHLESGDDGWDESGDTWDEGDNGGGDEGEEEWEYGWEDDCDDENWDDESWDDESWDEEGRWKRHGDHGDEVGPGGSGAAPSGFKYSCEATNPSSTTVASGKRPNRSDAAPKFAQRTVVGATIVLATMTVLVIGV